MHYDELKEKYNVSVYDGRTKSWRADGGNRAPPGYTRAEGDEGEVDLDAVTKLLEPHPTPNLFLTLTLALALTLTLALALALTLTLALSLSRTLSRTLSLAITPSLPPALCLSPSRKRWPCSWRRTSASTRPCPPRSSCPWRGRHDRLASPSPSPSPTYNPNPNPSSNSSPYR